MRRSWVPVALATVVAAVACLQLASWQWARGRSSGALLHYTYAVEWALLAVLLVVGAVVTRRRATRPRDREAASRDVHGRLVGPPLRPGEQLAAPVRTRVGRRLRGQAVAQLKDTGS